MKIFSPTLFSSKATALLIAIGSLVGITNANAQVNLTFTGGGVGNAPLTITFTTPITYRLTGDGSASGGAQPFFIFAGVGDVYNFHQLATVGSPSYTGIDGTFAINNISSGWGIHNDVGPNDVVATNYSGSQTTQMLTGATFTLAPGTLTTGVAFTGSLPADGSYSTFITDASFHLTGAGSAIPEPSTYAAFAGLGVLGFAAWRRRKSVPAKLTA